MSKKSEEKIIKETKYCKIINQGKVREGEYTYSIEKIYIKELKRDEVRFCVYKATRRGDETYIPRSLDVTELELIEATRRGDETYIPRSLDVTELELIELIKESIKNKVFSEEFIEMLKQELNRI